MAPNLKKGVLSTKHLNLELRQNDALCYPFHPTHVFLFSFFSCRSRCMMTAGDGFPRNAGLEVIDHQSFLPLP